MNKPAINPDHVPLLQGILDGIDTDKVETNLHTNGMPFIIIFLPKEDDVKRVTINFSDDMFASGWAAIVIHGASLASPGSTHGNARIVKPTFEAANPNFPETVWDYLNSLGVPIRHSRSKR